MKMYALAVMAMILFGCNGSSSDTGTEDELSLWGESSQRIVIVQDNGNVPPGEDRYVTYDYSRDTLSLDAKEILPTIELVEDDLSCILDGTTYKITITDSSGLDDIYYSSNMACNANSGRAYVSTEDIRILISLFPVN